MPIWHVHMSLRLPLYIYTGQMSFLLTSRHFQRSEEAWLSNRNGLL